MTRTIRNAARVFCRVPPPVPDDCAAGGRTGWGTDSNAVGLYNCESVPHPDRRADETGWGTRPYVSGGATTWRVKRKRR